MPAKGGRYHHGDLRSALVDAAIAVIAERGVRGFSLAEATRRLGVTTAAPYRHFAARQRPLFDTIFNSGWTRAAIPSCSAPGNRRMRCLPSSFRSATATRPQPAH
jgi:AcrR family transcriptional regulator